jgi:type II secretory pathway pseudopilin PulG
MLFRRPIRSTRRPDDGYILITLIMFVAVLAIAMTVTAPALLFQLKRDREEELIHRGTQYTRAIQHYYKKFNSYPNTLENLESSNQLRFLRRRYKDPLTGKDFKILHMQDVQGMSGPGLNGATSASNLAGGAGANGPIGLNSPGGAGGAFGGFGNQGGPGGLSGGSNGPNSGGIGANQILQQAPAGAGGTAGSAGANNQAGPAGSESEDEGTPQQGGTSNSSGPGPGAPGTGSGAGSSFGSSSGSNNQTFGGGPILGVASTSKDKTIRIFNKKERYYQWQFVYDPTLDQGGLIKTPYQQISAGSSTIQGATPAGGVQGQTPGGGQAPGTPGAGGLLGQPNQPVTQPNQPSQSNQGITPNMPPEQEQ